MHTPQRMNPIPIASSVIASLQHDPGTNVLEVVFHTGRVYEYFLVQKSVFEELLRAESVGEYFNKNIRNNYRCREVIAE